MKNETQMGSSIWTNDELRDSIPQFLELYEKRPIKDNQGGMSSPHMFATWFILRKINPKYVVESGIWKGQGTWLIEHTLPKVRLTSIDINLSYREYVSEKVKYYSDDFAELDWSIIADKEDTVLFFDDHQNALNRIKIGYELGFKHFIFEDNYPANQGDCYSLKKVIQCSGHNPVMPNRGIRHLAMDFIKRKKSCKIKPNSKDLEYLQSVVEVYNEFPPVIKKPKTRWGDKWNDEKYPTPAPLFNEVRNDLMHFEKDAASYTWICYVKLK